MIIIFRWIVFFPIGVSIAAGISYLLFPTIGIARSQWQLWYIEWFYYFLGSYSLVLIGTLIAPKIKTYISIMLYIFIWVLFLSRVREFELSSIVIVIISNLIILIIPLLFWFNDQNNKNVENNYEDESAISILFSIPGGLFYMIGGFFGLFVNLSFLHDYLGWGFFRTMAAFFLFPITLVFAPWYAGIGFDYYFPLFLTYGGIGVGIVFGIFKMIIIKDEY